MLLLAKVSITSLDANYNVRGYGWSSYNNVLREYFSAYLTVNFS